MSTGSQVLVLSDDPMFAALLGMFAELADFVPAFPAAGERAEEALARVRPLHVVLLDGALDAARSDLFFAAAARRRVGVAVIGTPGTGASLPAPARARSVPYFHVPMDLDQFRAMLRAATESKWWLRGGERRQDAAAPASHTEQEHAGGFVYVDRRGRRWTVYDRRGGERRTATPEPTHRVFVSDAGEVLDCALIAGEEAETEPEQLEEQLARASRG